MAFESLSEKLQNVFKSLKGKGKLTEADVKAAMKEIKMVLLEADVNFKVVKSFVKSIEEKRELTDEQRDILKVIVYNIPGLNIHSSAKYLE